MKSSFIILIIALAILLSVGSYYLFFANNGIDGTECSFLEDNSLEFPCELFIPINEIPSEYVLEYTDEGYLVGKTEPNDISFGPRENVIDWYYAVYTKETPNLGTPSISYNIVEFTKGADKSPNIEKVSEIDSQMTAALGYGVELIESGDFLIIIMPLGGSTEEDTNAFKNKINSLLN